MFDSQFLSVHASSKREKERERENETMIELKRGWAGRRASVIIEMASEGEIGVSSSKTPKTETLISEVLKYWLMGLIGGTESSKISIFLQSAKEFE